LKLEVQSVVRMTDTDTQTTSEQQTKGDNNNC